MEQRKNWRRMKAVQRLFSLAGLAPGTSFKWVDDQFPVCFKFSGKKFYAPSQSWMCLKLYFLRLCYFVSFLKARPWNCFAGDTCVLGLEGAGWLCHRGATLLLPGHGDPRTGEQLLLFFLTSGRLSPALLSQMLYASSAAPKVKGRGQNCCVL